MAIVFLLFLGALGLVFAGMGALGAPRWYWGSALCLWTFSILGYSIALLLLVLPYALGALAAAHSLKWVKKTYHSALAMGAGVGLWWLLVFVLRVDDYWLFFPVNAVFEAIF